MVSISQRVASYLSRDGVIQEALRRGIVNHRALARWMIDSQAWEASEEAVVSALRRHAGDVGESVFTAAAPFLEDVQLSMRPHACVMVLKPEVDLAGRLRELIEIVDLGSDEALRVVETEKYVTLVLHETNRSAVEEILDASVIENVKRNVTEIGILASPEGLEAPGFLATVLTELAARDVTLVELFSGSGKALVFVREEDGPEAYRALNQLVEDATGRSRSEG